MIIHWARSLVNQRLICTIELTQEHKPKMKLFRILVAIFALAACFCTIHAGEPIQFHLNQIKCNSVIFHFLNIAVPMHSIKTDDLDGIIEYMRSLQKHAIKNGK